MNHVTKTMGRGVSILAGAAWKGVRAVDTFIPNKSFKP